MNIHVLLGSDLAGKIDVYSCFWGEGNDCNVNIEVYSRYGCYGISLLGLL